MRVVIHAPAARMGGARSHLLGLVPELAAISPEDEFLLVAQPDLVQRLPRLPGSWEVRVEQPQRLSLVRRVWWEQRHVARAAAHWRAHVLLSFGSFVPLRGACPAVLEAGNALPFTPRFWRETRRRGLRMAAAEIARWILLQASLRASERALAPSQSMAADVLRRLPELRPRLDVAEWGVAEIFHQRRWHATSGPPRIVGISKHGINKEFDVLVTALDLLKAEIPAARLALTGTCDESPWAERSARLAANRGLSQRVEFVGDLPNTRIPDLIQSASVVVFPTWCESFGLPLAEALAMGAPAIAADIPACREVGGNAALYYAPGNPESLAARLTEVLTQTRCAEWLPRAARERGQRFRWSENARLVRATLQAAAAHKVS